MIFLSSDMRQVWPGGDREDVTGLPVPDNRLTHTALKIRHKFDQSLAASAWHGVVDGGSCAAYRAVAF